MLLLRFFGQPVSNTSPGPSSPVESQTIASRQKTPAFDGDTEPAFPPVLSQSANISQRDTPTTASSQKEQDDSHSRLSYLNNDRVTASASVNLKRKLIATDLAETSENRLAPAISDRSIPIETATSAPRARSDLLHFMGYDNQFYRCICGTTIEPEAGTSIQCESCLAWQHAGCFGLGGDELEGTTYFCELCSDETGKHQPDELYVKYIRHLAETSVPVHVPLLEDTKQPTDEYAKETKRSRFTGSSRGKGRVRQSVTLPKPIEVDVPEVPATPLPSEPVTTVPPRTQRKKSVLSSRIPKSKPSSVSGPVTQEHPLIDDVQDGAVLREPTSDLETTSRILDYIPIFDDLITTACSGGQVSTPSHLKYSGIPTLRSKPTVQTSQGPSTNRSEVMVSTTKIKPSVSNSDRATQLTFIKAVTPDNPIRSSIGSSGIVAEEHQYRPSCIAPQYGVFARCELTSGQSIGQMCGEIYSLATYVQEPANQYAVIGLPKPFVQRVGSPFDVVVDARRYGNDLRFVRSSCEANAVLVPLSKPEESLIVEISLTRAVQQGEEITLPWAWDDFHLVHELRGSPAFPRSHSQSDRLAGIGRHLARVFKSCACHDRSTCLLSRISELAVNLEPPTSQSTRDRTQSSSHALSRSFSVSQERCGWQRSSPGATRKNSLVHVELLHDLKLLDLDFNQPYDLDYNSYGYAAIYEDDLDWLNPTTDESSIDDFAKSSSDETEGSWHQDLRSSLSEEFVIHKRTAGSGIVWNTSSPSDMDVADEIASVSETSTLTEPIWQDDQEDDLLDLRSLGLRRHSASEAPGAIGLEAAQLLDLTSTENIREMMGPDQAGSPSQPASLHLRATSTVVHSRILPAANAQEEERSLLKLDPEGVSHPNMKPDGTLIADPGGGFHGEKPEMHAKKQRIDLTKFMHSGSSVDRHLSGATYSSNELSTGDPNDERIVRMDSTITRSPSKVCAVAAQSTIPATTPWWKRSDSGADDHRSQAHASPARPAHLKTSDPGPVGD
jgi:hypothetical protein